MKTWVLTFLANIMLSIVLAVILLSLGMDLLNTSLIILIAHIVGPIATHVAARLED